MKKTLFIALAACALLVCVGCKNSADDDPAPVAVESVTLNVTTLSLAPGAKGKLTATVTPDNADDKTVAWSSSNSEVATVGEDGTVTAVGIGEATVTANAGGKEAKCQVTVRQILVAVQSVALDQKTLTLTRGETGKLTATVTPDNADDKTVAWSSSDTSVATVDNNGMVTAVSKGTATITAQAGGKTATCVIKVHTHSYSNGKCTVCGFVKPSMPDGEIDDDGVLTKYKGNAATVYIPDGVTSIWQNAFKGCTSLASVTIPASVTSIGRGAFEGCESLTDVTYKGTLAQWCALSNDWYLISYAKTVTVEGTDLKQATTLAIPDGVTSIGEAAFYGCRSLASVTIGKGVTSIGEAAFYGCRSLASVTIGKGVTSIGDLAFDGCTSLTSVTYGGTKDGWSKIERGYFIFNSTTQITDKDGVTFTVDRRGNITE